MLHSSHPDLFRMEAPSKLGSHVLSISRGRIFIRLFRMCLFAALCAIFDSPIHLPAMGSKLEIYASI